MLPLPLLQRIQITGCRSPCITHSLKVAKWHTECILITDHAANHVIISVLVEGAAHDAGVVIG